jgi:hypothetical protein
LAEYWNDRKVVPKELGKCAPEVALPGHQIRIFLSNRDVEAGIHGNTLNTETELLEHPPYSPDMSPCDYDLFGKMEETL